MKPKSYKMLELPKRNKKPRIEGLTSIHDISLTSVQLESILCEHSDFVDFAKFGVGTAYFAPRLKKKVEIYQSHNIHPYFGGTLFEKFYAQGKLNDFLAFMDQNGVRHLEISTGTIDIDLKERIELTKELSKRYTVLTEVGTKDADEIMPPSKWIYEINSLFDAGAAYIITEGRNSGTAGIFRPSGELRSGLIEDIISNCDVSKLIFEAPIPKAQMFFINKVGCNVNLGNVSPHDLLLLETQRQALRSETFFLK